MLSLTYFNLRQRLRVKVCDPSLMLTHDASHIKQCWKVSCLSRLKMSCNKWCGLMFITSFADILCVWVWVHVCASTDRHLRCKEGASRGKCSWPAWRRADRERTPPPPAGQNTNTMNTSQGNIMVFLWHTWGWKFSSTLCFKKIKKLTQQGECV